MYSKTQRLVFDFSTSLQWVLFEWTPSVSITTISPGKNITDKLSTDCVKCTRFTADTPCTVGSFAYAKRSEAVRVTKSNKLCGSHNYAGICTLNIVHSLFNRFFGTFWTQTIFYNGISNTFGIGSAVEYSAFEFYGFSYIIGINKIAVVCKCKITFDVANNKRLNVVMIFAAVVE